MNSFHKEATSNPSAPVFHELRHTVRSALFAAKVDRATIGRLIGHDTGLSAADEVYTHIPDEDVKAALGTLKYPGLRLQRVYSR